VVLSHSTAKLLDHPPRFVCKDNCPGDRACTGACGQPVTYEVRSKADDSKCQRCVDTEAGGAGAGGAEAGDAGAGGAGAGDAGAGGAGGEALLQRRDTDENAKKKLEKYIALCLQNAKRARTAPVSTLDNWLLTWAAEKAEKLRARPRHEDAMLSPPPAFAATPLMRYLWALLVSKRNVVIMGPPGSGKVRNVSFSPFTVCC
jgi:hypothetical protein